MKVSFRKKEDTQTKQLAAFKDCIVTLLEFILDTCKQIDPILVNIGDKNRYMQSRIESALKNIKFADLWAKMNEKQPDIFEKTSESQDKVKLMYACKLAKDHTLRQKYGQLITLYFLLDDEGNIDYLEIQTYTGTFKSSFDALPEILTRYRTMSINSKPSLPSGFGRAAFYYDTLENLQENFAQAKAEGNKGAIAIYEDLIAKGQYYQTEEDKQKARSQREAEREKLIEERNKRMEWLEKAAKNAHKKGDDYAEFKEYVENVFENKLNEEQQFLEKWQSNDLNRKGYFTTYRINFSNLLADLKALEYESLEDFYKKKSPNYIEPKNIPLDFGAKKEPEKPKNTDNQEFTLRELDKRKEELSRKVEPLVKLKKELYSDVDIESPKSIEEKQLEEEIAAIFSEINGIVKQKREIQKKQTPTQPANKEPWEMGFEEFSKIIKTETKTIGNGKKTFYVEDKGKNKDFALFKTYHKTGFASDKVQNESDAKKMAHKEYLKQAIAEGKPVPSEVLAEYPDLNVQKTDKPANKEPWEMSFEEFSKIIKTETKNIGNGKKTFYVEDKGKNKDFTLFKTYHKNGFASDKVQNESDAKKMAHKEYLKQALSEGKPVPSEVLAEYPDSQVQKVKEDNKKVEEMAIAELEQASADFDEKIKAEKARLDKIDPDRQIFSGAGITYLSEKDANRYAEINDELGRRSAISSKEAQKRVEEKRKARVEEKTKKDKIGTEEKVETADNQSDKQKKLKIAKAKEKERARQIEILKLKK